MVDNRRLRRIVRTKVPVKHNRTIELGCSYPRCRFARVYHVCVGICGCVLHELLLGKCSLLGSNTTCKSSRPESQRFNPRWRIVFLHSRQRRRKVSQQNLLRRLGLDGSSRYVAQKYCPGCLAQPDRCIRSSKMFMLWDGPVVVLR